jgi:hypothetical protein
MVILFTFFYRMIGPYSNERTKTVIGLDYRIQQKLSDKNQLFGLDYHTFKVDISF